MTTDLERLRQAHLVHGGAIAQDGIPLHYGDLLKEYQAALNAAVIMERSHEGRLSMRGTSRFDLLQRMSTNDMLSLKPSEGRATIFTNANARILDRVTVFHSPDSALIFTEPGRAQSVHNYLNRNIFFNDDAHVIDLTPTTRQFNIHGATADYVINHIAPQAVDLPPMHSMTITLADTDIFIARAKPMIGSHWLIKVDNQAAADVWESIVQQGASVGLVPAGSLTYNTLRIRSGRPGVMRELSADYIPLEIGLWDEVSFQKGCYIGQEIIARMESRGRLAKTIVSLTLESMSDAPMPLLFEGREVGRLTSSVTAPDGEIFAVGVVKLDMAIPGHTFTLPNGIRAHVCNRIGEQPEFLQQETNKD